MRRQLKADAVKIFQAGLKAADPAVAVGESVRLESEHLVLGREQELVLPVSEYDSIVAVAFGKAGAVMARALEERLGDRLTGGLAVVKYGHRAPTRKVEVLEAGHPVPDQAGLAGARRVAALLESCDSRTLVICLISGGGSALLPLPAEGITLSDKVETTSLLLRSGADIAVLNCVRKHLSGLKGGQLACKAAPATVVSLILSDVVGDRLDVIASGPTVPDDTAFQDAVDVLHRSGLWDTVPRAGRGRLTAGAAGELEETPGSGHPAFARCQNLLVANNALCLQAAARQARNLGYQVVDLGPAIEGEASEVARDLVARAGRQPRPTPTCWLGGGETTVTVTGPGKGGRAQEFALSATLAMQGWDNALLLAAGTDGTDGPTDAAGAFASGDTVARGKALGLDAATHLRDNNAYRFFDALGDLLVTGPTGTNVMDVYMLLTPGS